VLGAAAWPDRKAIAMNSRHFDIGALEADIEGGMS
jgi:hypothetical protein